MRIALWSIRLATEALALLGLIWGAWVGIGGPLGIATAFLAPAVAGVVWGLWVAPASRRRLRDPARFAIEAAVFIGGAAGFAAAVSVPGGVVFGVLALTLAALMRIPRLREPVVDPADRY